MGWRIFWASVLQVFGNFSLAVKASLPYLISALTLYVYEIWIIDPETITGLVVTIVLILFMLFSTLWSAVSWHRFLLIKENPNGAFPELHLTLMIGYLKYSILVILINVPFIIISLLIAILGNLPIIVNIAFLFIQMWVNFRICLVLPATAVGKRISLLEAWKTTKPVSGALIVLTFVSFIPFALMNAIASSAPSVDLVFGLVANVVVGWCNLIFFISIMTTLYKNLIDGGELRKHKTDS